MPSTGPSGTGRYHDPMKERHDVVIVGGGLVGASLAIALDRQGLDVGLVEASPPGQMPAVFDQHPPRPADEPHHKGSVICFGLA